LTSIIGRTEWLKTFIGHLGKKSHAVFFVFFLGQAVFERPLEALFCIAQTKLIGGF
jgi:hypothetical protein